VLSIEH